MTQIKQEDLIESVSAALQYISYYHQMCIRDSTRMPARPRKIPIVKSTPDSRVVIRPTP